MSKPALAIASFTPQDLLTPHFVGSSKRIIPSGSLRFSKYAMTSEKLHRTATSARKIVERTIRKIQVPAYWLAEDGIQDSEKSAVEVPVKKVIIISEAGIMPMSMSIEEEADEVAMDME
jgi:hypothetical protein